MYKCPICNWSPKEDSFYNDPHDIIVHEREHKKKE